MKNKPEKQKKELFKVDKTARFAIVIGKIVRWSLIVPIFFLILKIFSIDELYIDPLTNRSRSDYILMIIQCLLGVFALSLPEILYKKKLQIPTNMYLLYVVFLYCAIFLGEVRSFYFRIPNWDTILHTFSGGMIGALGFSFISLLNKTEDFHLKLTPGFVAIFSFMLSATLGVLWEVYEFAFDGILGLNMQKFMLESGEQLIGRAALADTMEDLIVDMIGAFGMSVIGYISLKYKKGWVERLLIKVRKHGSK